MGAVWNWLGQVAAVLDPAEVLEAMANSYEQEAMRISLARRQARLQQLDEQLFGDGEDYEEEEEQQQQPPRLGQQRPALGNGQQQGGGVSIPPRRGKGRPPGSKNKAKPPLPGPQPSPNGNGGHQP